MPAARSTAKPATSNGKVDFDLTTLDIQPDAPVAVKVAPGVVVHLRNIIDLDWQVIATLSQERPYDFFEHVVVEADQEKFLAAKISGKQLGEMQRFYYAHFDLRPGESPA